MCSRCLSTLLCVVPLLADGPATLRVCADPNNLPFSNEHEEGFENRIARSIAREMGVSLEFVWWAGRTAVVRNTLNEDRCDVLMGIPAGVDSVAVTQPYYRSTYVFVMRKDRTPQVTSIEDARLATMRIGMQMLGEDYSPPSIALGRRGIAANVTGYRLTGALGLVHAVAAGDVDVAIAWGPLAGYLAQRETTPLALTPVDPPSYLGVPFVYDMAMGVRKGNNSLRTALDQALRRDCADVQSILREYGVPQAPGGGSCEGLPALPAASSR